MDGAGLMTRTNDKDAARLICTRRVGETLVIEPASGVDLNMAIGELFAAGSIVVAIMETQEIGHASTWMRPMR